MMDTGRPQRTIRGPVSLPSRIASRSLNMVWFFGPFSRMEVTPENKAILALRADWSVSTSSGSAARSSPARPSPNPLL